jgi:hypothetical protein
MEEPMRCIAVALLTLVGFAPLAAHAQTATMYKNPQCGCCEGHADYLRKHGIAVTMIDTLDAMSLKREHGVPPALAGCHTVIIEGYVVEGHVPVASIRSLLQGKPAIRGISLPGMPNGSPGMGGAKTEPFVIYEISAGPPTAQPRVFAIE